MPDPFRTAMALAAAVVTPSAATAQAPDIAPLVHYEAVHPNEPAGDRLSVARRLAATIVAQDKPAPVSIVNVGAFTGEFLEPFMERFPQAPGQWTEPVPDSYGNARKRLGRFGERIDYLIGCAGRDLAEGCLTHNADVVVTSWLSIHQNFAGIQRYYREAAAAMPAGGWVINLDHVGFGATAWGKRLTGARAEAVRAGLTATTEGPPVHHPEFVTPTLDDHLAALQAAGFDGQVVWQRLDTVLLMGRKK